MKIVFDYYTFLNQKYGGVSRYFTELYKAYSRFENVEIDIPIKYAMNDYLSNIEVKFSMIDESVKNSVWLMKMYAYLNQKHIAKYLSSNECDIIHPTWYSPYVYELNGNHKIVCTVYDMIQELFWKEKDSQTIFRKKQAMLKSDSIIAISQSTKADILRLYPEIPEEKINVVYLGANNLNEKLSKIDCELPEKYIIYVGKREDYKNGMFIIEALHELVKDYDVHLLFIGGGKFSDIEEELICKYKIGNLVHQLNVTDSELAYIYRHAECFIFPTKYEGFGFPVLEAFENDCPVICTNSSSLPEVAGEAALYFDVDDVKGCIANVESILNDKLLRNRLISLGQEQVKKFTWEKTAINTIEVYNSVLR